MTVRDLLTHRAGLGNADFLWYGQSNTTEEILPRLRLVEPAYSLRSRFIYQNIMYAVAGSDRWKPPACASRDRPRRGDLSAPCPRNPP